ncbi:MAG: hypothetical protein HY925_13185, partial [Elusimicrobia bacterium]|nr:hypothetical protein [Elusimicrobiota bacterium]
MDKRIAAVVAALALIGLGVLAFVRRDPSGPSLRQQPFVLKPGSDSLTMPSSSAGSDEAADEKDRLYAGKQDGSALSFSDMVRSLSGLSGLKGVQEFKKEFREDPGLRRVFDKYEAMGEPDPGRAADFMAEVRQEAAFAPLMQKWLSKPEGMAALDVLS